MTAPSTIRGERAPDPGGDESGAATRAMPLAFDAVYGEWFRQVSRWAGALGGPSADLEDIAQEVFLVVRRRLPDFDGRNLPGWLYRITSRAVADCRRRAWFRHLFHRKESDLLERLPHGGPSPADAMERLQDERQLYALLARMAEKRRRVLILFEIEGYSGEEIAELEGAPVATVWTRLHRARKDFLVLVEEHRARREA